MLTAKIPMTGNYVHTTDDNSIVESGVNKRDCNRFISVGINDLKDLSIVPFFTASTTVYIMNEKKSKKVHSFSASEFPDWLMQDLGVYDPRRDKVFKLCSISMTNADDEYSISSPERHFNISHICPDPNKINNFEMYYLFKLDKDKLRTYYPHAENPYELRKAIIANAHKRLCTPFKNRIYKYYIDVIDYIEDVLQRILSIDIEKMIIGEIDESIVSAFNIDYDYIVEYLENNDITYEKSLYLYLMIERAISDFTIQIKVGVDETARQIACYIDTARIKVHIELLEDFISSDKIQKAISIQENDENEYPERYRLISDDMTWEQKQLELYKKKAKGLFKNLRCEIETYSNFLKIKLKKE